MDRLKSVITLVQQFTFSDPTLLAGRQEGHLACKKVGGFGLLTVTI